MPRLFQRQRKFGFCTALLLQLLAGSLSAQDASVETFNRVLVGPKQHTARETFRFPDEGLIYEKVLLRFSLEEPDQGWDVWDREGGLFLTGEDGEEYELYRIITPYQQEWEWEVDVTHFQSLLRGEREMRCTITSWSGGGYLVSANFEFHRGNVGEFPARIVNLWNGRTDLADANEAFFQTRSVEIPSWASRVELYFVVTGHWGPNNVAEFTRTTREVSINGGDGWTNQLWRSDCGSNPVNRQAGTWRASRAGWCPGDPVAPWVIDVSEHALPGRMAQISYEITQPNIADHPNSLGEGTHIVSSQAVFYRAPKDPFLLEEGDSLIAVNHLAPDAVIRTYHLFNPTDSVIRWSGQTSDPLIVSTPSSGELAAGDRVAIHVIAVTPGDGFPIGTTEAIFSVLVEQSQRLERMLVFNRQLIPRGSMWRYNDTGSDLGTEWRQLSYDDGDWPNGAAELGYGDGDEVTVVSFGEFSDDKIPTVYFRQIFDFSLDPEQIQSGEVQIKRDDGAAVYLNGRELFRTNLPEGELTFDTFAEGSTGNENRYHSFGIPDLASYLRPGLNVIAVEVHQGSSSSSDLSFDLEFGAEVSSQLTVGFPAISIDAVVDHSVTIHWRADHPDEWELHASDDLTNWRRVIAVPDEPAGGADKVSVTVPVVGEAAYYRLERLRSN